MAGSSDDTDSEQPLRSARDDRFALVTFESKTSRRIDVFWLDYDGQRVKYATLEVGATFPIMTYETHPWIFRDVDNGAPILADGKEVYFPKAYDGREDPPVHIHIPGVLSDNKPLINE
ncbi:hypothetical protein LSH36_650g01073 [Paralvinella palmiformis]|uniref:von Hippel-Lindau disease tumour suppressor beta domain-containing protein n=1 Tax=Paralvinella palmiformis TaxID=53620 RepID=A0AAD9J4A4_9ANNE|nr:hypothetical protein LSH36_650g01073 [Paralvinella palmiformis]